MPFYFINISKYINLYLYSFRIGLYKAIKTSIILVSKAKANINTGL